MTNERLLELQNEYQGKFISDYVKALSFELVKEHNENLLILQNKILEVDELIKKTRLI